MSQLLVKSPRLVGVLFLFLAASPAFSQGASVPSPTDAGVDLRFDNGFKSDLVGTSESESILTRFVAAETKVREALNKHAFKRNVVLQTIGPNGEVTGEYIRNSQFVFDDRGQRVERVTFHPASTIREMRITKEDIQDLAGAQLLGIDIVEADKYRLTYVGAETVDSRQLFAIDVAPLAQPDPNHMRARFFVGRVWVNPTNFQIVKIKGIVEPQGKQRFPLFETWREPVNGPLAFPSRTEADDVLHFRNRDVHYRIKVRCYDYKLFGSKVSITELDEAPPKLDEAQPKVSATPPGPNEAPPKMRATPSKTIEVAPGTEAVRPKQLPIPTTNPPSKAQVCKTNRDAPPVGDYHWPADSDVKVFFLRNAFTTEQRAALLDAMEAWTTARSEIGSGVRFVDAGETEIRENCRSCLTVRRRDVYKQDKHHYAFFYPMIRDAGGLLVSAWIDLDFGTTSSTALKGFMVHELAHGLGLWDCTTCKKKRTIMNSFPGVNQDNGLVIPSSCDLATVREVYQEERRVAAVRLTRDQRQEGDPSDRALAPSLIGLEKAAFSLLDLQRPLIGGAARARTDSDKRPEAIPAKSILALPPLGFERARFSLHDLRRSHVNRLFFFSGDLF
jgi:hypothetical protein